MSRDLMKTLGPALLLLVVVASGCADGPRPPSARAPTLTTQEPSAATETLDPQSPPIADASNCDVTRPVRAPAAFADRLFGSSAAYGNDALWVGGLGDRGVILADPSLIEPDGSIGWKLGWWRIEPGSLTITGRRLDAVAPPLRVSIPDGYGREGFQASGVTFPTDGCWEVTGLVGDASLTFVTYVVRA